jgi:hypothetical protein
VGKYVLPNVGEFTGTAPYTVMLKGNPNPQTAGSNYEVSGTIASFTDKTGAPGRLNCIPMTGNIDFSTSETVAKGQPVSFAVITNPTVPPAESITYTWSAFNSNGLGGPSYMPTAPVITGAYTVTLTARSEGYCDLTKSKKVEVIDCFPSSTYDLVASAPGFCAGDAGVTFSLSRTEYGRSYELYKGATTVTTLIGTGSAATFSGAQTEGIYTARVLASADGYCEAEMSGSPTISRNSLPTAPTISQPVDVCFNGGSIVFTATGYTGSLTWVSTGGGSESGNSVTFASGAATGTKAVTARSAQTYTNNAPTCYSAEVTQLASVLALPATPTLAVSASTVCLGTNIVFRVTVPESGATYTWSGAEGTASGIGDGTYTVSSATTSTVSVTAHARKLVNETTCQSGNASLSAVVSQPSAVGQEQHPVCGCASPGIPCSGQCRTSCGPDFTSDCQSNQWNPELFSPSIVDCYNACVAYAATYRYYYYVTLNPGSLGARCTCYRCN